MTCHAAPCTEHEVQRTAGTVEAHAILCRDAEGRQQLCQPWHVDAGVDTSCKTAFVMSLLAELVAKGHRTLIFSQSRVMLDILQAAIVEQSYAFRRIDGSISSAAERQVSVFTCMPAVCSLACRLKPYKALKEVAVWQHRCHFTQLCMLHYVAAVSAHTALQCAKAAKIASCCLELPTILVIDSASHSC